MKNLFTILAGIVFLLAIPLAGCSQVPDKVTIELTAVVEINGVKHLLMRDSNDMTCIGIDALFTTDVYKGQKVKWKAGKYSGIQHIKKIEGRGDHSGAHSIFKNNPQPTSDNEGLEMIIPEEAVKGAIEKYFIIYHLKGDTTGYLSDPYLRIPED
jgi:hypothetical protein